MSAGLKGDPRTLREIGRAIVRAGGVVAAQRTAARVAPELTAAALASFDARETPYGDAWAPGHDGGDVDLYESGALKSGLTFAATGTRVRCVLGAKHAKYQIGKRQVLPPGGRALPAAWRDRIDAVAREEIARTLKEAG